MRSAEIKGLAVFSIRDGREIGKVKDLLINPDQKSVDYLIVDVPNWCFGLQVVPHNQAAGIGTDAVMVDNSDKLIELNQEFGGIELLQSGVRIIGSKALTKKGVIIGTISEYHVNVDTGKIIGYELIDNDNFVKGIIPGRAMITLGREVLVVESDMELLQEIDEQEEVLETEAIEEELPVQKIKEEVKKTIPKVAEPEEDPADKDKTVKLFEQRQREYLLGRTARNNIKDSQGNIIVQKGEVITQEIIDKVTLAGKFKELMLDV